MLQSLLKTGAARRLAPCCRLAPCRRLASCRSGNVSTMTALLLPVGIALAAVSVDAASLYLERRETQNLTDLAAITAAANIDRAELAAKTVFMDNGVTRIAVAARGSLPGVDTNLGSIGTAIIVEPGRYLADPEISVDRRFLPGGMPVNAVKVTATRAGSQFFSRGIMAPPTIAASAVASVSPEAMFSIGSRLASVNGGLTNAILGGLLGTRLSLSVMDYEQLIAADVDAFRFLDVLATDLRLRAASYQEVLDAEATVAQLAGAMARVDGVTTQQASALRLLARTAGGAGAAKLPLSHMFDLGHAASLALGDRPGGLNANVGVMDIIGGGAAIANGGNQVRLNLGAEVPGLLGLTLDVAVGEPPQFSPWLTLGERGDFVRTAQTRLLLTAEIGAAGALGASVKLPVYVELAFAEGSLANIECPTGHPESLRVTIAARPGVAELRIASLDAARLGDFTRKPSFARARIVNATLVSIYGQAHVEIANLAPTNLVFNKREIDQVAVKSVSTRNLAQSLTQSLLSTLRLDVEIIGLGLGLPGNLGNSLANLLGTVTPAIDGVLYNILTTLGVRVGEADVRVHGATCGRSVLVQ